MAKTGYAENVFVNVPFDLQYKPLFESLIFTIIDCNFVPRCAKDHGDDDERLSKIVKLIRECKYGIHDISRTEIDKDTKLPRFNMPLELGIFLGAKKFGGGNQSQKVCLVLDKEKYRYHASTSDIKGLESDAHKDKPQELIAIVRDWLRNSSKRKTIPSGQIIWKRYQQFRVDLPSICRKNKWSVKDPHFIDFKDAASIWLENNIL
ncbi:MAG TPA: hypothetical protein ENH84_07225 [Phycisphaerae bacterium]|nr:hypothetical protein [Phycisphaerae bacterium]